MPGTMTRTDDEKMEFEGEYVDSRSDIRFSLTEMTEAEIRDVMDRGSRNPHSHKFEIRGNHGKWFLAGRAWFNRTKDGQGRFGILSDDPYFKTPLVCWEPSEGEEWRVEFSKPQRPENG